MSVLVRGSWTPQRTELERVLSDGEWHPVPGLLGAMSPFVDPRLAARAWFRAHRGAADPREDDLTPAEKFAAHEREALAWGRRYVAEQSIRQLIAAGRLEITGWRHGDRDVAFKYARVRLSEIARQAERVCMRGHALPSSGQRCLECRRIRRCQKRGVCIAAD